MIPLNIIIRNKNIPSEVILTQTPAQHQLKNYQELSQYIRALDRSPVGTGKSLVSYLRIMENLYDGKKVLVIMPPGLVFQYLHNFRSIVLNHPFTSFHLNGDRSRRHKLMEQWEAENMWPDVLCMSYQLFVKYANFLNRSGYYAAIITDEAHNIGTVKTKVFQLLYAYVYGRREVSLLMMTATVTLTELQTCYSAIKLKDKESYTSLDQFDRLHTEYEKRTIMLPDRHGELKPKQIPVITGYKNLELLKANLNKYAVTCDSRKVLSLKDPRIIKTPALLHIKHQALYRKFMEERLLELGAHLVVAKNSSALRQTALQLITNPNKFLTKEEAFSVAEHAPLETLVNLVSSMPLKETKLLVFCHFQETVKMLAKYFQEYNPALVYGESNVQSNVQKMLHDDTCRMAILNYASGGAGFNLQPVSYTIVMYEAIGSPGLIEQALGRVHRKGQIHPVICYIYQYVFSLSADLVNKALDRAGVIKEASGDECCFVDFISENLLDI